MSSDVSKRILFAREYFASGCSNATNAYMKVYESDNKATAKANASRLLKAQDVIAEIETLRSMSDKILSCELNDTQKAITYINTRKDDLQTSKPNSPELSNEVDNEIARIDKQINSLKNNEERLEYLLDANNRKKMLIDLAVYNNEEVDIITKTGDIIRDRRNSKEVNKSIDILNKMEGVYNDSNVNINVIFEDIGKDLSNIIDVNQVI